MKLAKISLCLAFTLLGISAMAQRTVLNSFNVDYSFSLHRQFTRLVEDEPSGIKHMNQSAVSFSYGRMLHDNIEAGLYCRLLFSEYYVYGDAESLTNHIVPALGMSLKYHILEPMQIVSEHFDAAICAIIGGTFAKGCQLEYGTGLNLGYFPFDHIGITAEALFGSFGIARYGTASTSDFQFNTGIIWRW